MLTTACIERDEKNGIAILGRSCVMLRSKGIMICEKKNHSGCLVHLLSMAFVKA